MKPINLDTIDVDVFQEVKDRADLRQIVSYYGCGSPKHNFICCPFHSEKTPSMRIYEKGYNCYGCGEKGGIIDFVMKLCNISAIEAVKKINSDFSLGLNIGSPSRSSKPKEKTVSKYQLIQYYEDWLKEAFRELNYYYKLLKDWLRDFAPKPDDEKTYPLWDRACKELPVVDHYCMILIQGSDTEKKELFIKHREEVERFVNEYRRIVGR